MPQKESVIYINQKGETVQVEAVIVRKKCYTNKVYNEVMRMFERSNPIENLVKSEAGIYNKTTGIFIANVTRKVNSFFAKVDRKQKAGFAACKTFQMKLFREDKKKLPHLKDTLVSTKI